MHLLSKQKDPVSAKKDKMIENKKVVCWFKEENKNKWQPVETRLGRETRTSHLQQNPGGEE